MKIVLGKGFLHHMIREIHEQSRAIRLTLTKEAKQARRIAEIIRNGKYEIIYITGSGTSYHVGLAGRYISVEKFCLGFFL
jgi:glucosamine 6-phosphate synthetase-like amidotransferase/phosphosugar isomerase protein